MRIPTVKQQVLVYLLVLLAHFSNAQSSDVKGYIQTSDGKPAASVNIQLKEIKKGVVSNEDGTYVIPNVPQGNYTLIVSFVGLQTQQKNITVPPTASQDYNFTLVENQNELKEVIVTSIRNSNEKTVNIGKLPIKPMDLPQSVASVGKDVIERQQNLRLSEVLTNVTGIYMMSNTGGSQEEFAGRGYAYTNSNTFKNGARYNNNIMPEVSALEKVEVLKGSAAILFGNIAAGGVLNLVTKKPKFDNGGEISFRAGSYDLYKPSIDIYGAVDNSKHIAYRLNSSYENAKSFRDNVGSERFYINPSLLFKIGKRVDIIAEGDYLKDNRTLDYGTGAVDYKVADVPRSRFLGAKWSYTNSSQKTATVTTTFHINKDWELRNITSGQGYSNELFGTTRPNASSQFVQSNGNWARGLQRTGTDEQYYITQFDVTGHFKTGKVAHTLLTGVDADKYITDAKAYVYANPAIGNKNVYDTINIYNLDKYKQRNDIPELTATTITHTPTKRMGIYVQDLISVAEKIKVLAGVRYTKQQTEGVYIDSLTKNKRTAVKDVSDDAFSPRFGVVYQPLKTVSIFASYSNSFTLNTGTDIYLTPLKPSYINQYEAGVKTELFKKAISANITFYQIVNSNLAQTALVDANGNPNNNTNIKELAGEVTSKGLEVDVTTRPVYGFQAIAGYSFNQTKYTESNTYIKGSKLRYNPEHTANASLYYTFSNRSSLKGFNVGVAAYYIGKRVAGRSTRIQVPNDTYKLMPLPDYTQFDLTAGYTIRKITVRVKASNLFNTLSYFVHDDNSINPIAPRQFSASLSYKL